MRHVYDSYDEAKRHESGQKRVYRVSLHGVTKYVVALSPRHAMGEAAPAFGMVAELTDPRYYLRNAGVSIEELVKLLSPTQRDELLRRIS